MFSFWCYSGAELSSDGAEEWASSKVLRPLFSLTTGGGVGMSPLQFVDGGPVAFSRPRFGLPTGYRRNALYSNAQEMRRFLFISWWMLSQFLLVLQHHLAPPLTRSQNEYMMENAENKMPIVSVTSSWASPQYICGGTRPPHP